MNQIEGRNGVRRRRAPFRLGEMKTKKSYQVAHLINFSRNIALRIGNLPLRFKTLGIMRLAERICGDICAIALRDPQYACKMSRRNRTISSPTVDRNGFDAALESNLFAGTDKLKNIFNCILHTPQNDYNSHNVKWLIQ